LTVSHELAQQLDAIATRVAHLQYSHGDPEKFYVERGGILADIRALRDGARDAGDKPRPPRWHRNPFRRAG